MVSMDFPVAQGAGILRPAKNPFSSFSPNSRLMKEGNVAFLEINQLTEYIDFDNNKHIQIFFFMVSFPEHFVDKSFTCILVILKKE